MTDHIDEAAIRAREDKYGRYPALGISPVEDTMGTSDRHDLLALLDNHRDMQVRLDRAYTEQLDHMRGNITNIRAMLDAERRYHADCMPAARLDSAERVIAVAAVLAALLDLWLTGDEDLTETTTRKYLAQYRAALAEYDEETK